MLQYVKFSEAAITAADLVAFEARHALFLPRAYKNFLLAHNGGQPTPRMFPIAGFSEDSYGGINSFYGLHASTPAADLDEQMSDLPDTVPRGIVPIAYTDGNDKLVLDLRKEGAPVLFWDFHAFWGNNIWNEKLLYPVAGNFEALLASLMTDEEAGLTV